MQTTPVTSAALARSVVAVPPLARNADFSLNRTENAKIIRHLETGGIGAILYGGNANFYHVRLGEYAEVLQMLIDLAGEDTLVIPSVGPAFGTMMEQARVYRELRFPTAMVLPQQGITTSAGVASGVRRFVEAAETPAVLYIKHDGYIDVADAGKLVDDQLVSIIKYAVVRDNPANDPYLRELTEAVDPKIIMSGIGEQPAIVHLRDFGLGGFTSGCVCVAPALSMQMLATLQAQDYDRAEQIRATFRPLEDLRNALSPIRVLHESLPLSGIAETGPLAPLLSNLEQHHHAAVAEAARALLEYNRV